MPSAVKNINFFRRSYCHCSDRTREDNNCYHSHSADFSSGIIRFVVQHFCDVLFLTTWTWFGAARAYCKTHFFSNTTTQWRYNYMEVLCIINMITFEVYYNIPIIYYGRRVFHKSAVCLRSVIWIHSFLVRTRTIFRRFPYNDEDIIDINHNQLPYLNKWTWWIYRWNLVLFIVYYRF